VSFLNAPAKQVFCKLAVHGDGAAGFVEVLASSLGHGAAVHEPSFRVVNFLVSGYEIGPYALRLCVYALDGGDVHALLAGADAITVILGGTAADRATVAAIAPYVNERVPVVLACRPDRDAGELGVAYRAISIDPATVDGARAVLRALAPQIAEAARAKWIRH
jgi:hypothetical protein